MMMMMAEELGNEGSDTDALINTIAQWVAMVLSFLSVFFYLDQYRKKQCGWEIIYVAIMEALLYVLLLGWGKKAPFLWKLDSKCQGSHDEGCWGILTEQEITYVPMARYFGWLLTCPVTLIALSNLTGLKDDYNWRTMKLLTADQGLILMGSTTALINKEVSNLKYVFFPVAVIFGFFTFYTALEVYVESYHNVPPVAKKTVSTMTYMFFFSWGTFPIYFLLGPEGFGHINQDWSDICHAITDLFAKNLWGAYSWYLRVQVREYHRKKWFEEQERLKLGEKEFDVPKEQRPEVTTGSVAAVFSGAAADEEEVDPAYADYRRQRRRNRGRSLSEPDPAAARMMVLGLVNNKDSAEKEAAEMKAMKQQQKMMQQQQNIGFNPMAMGNGMMNNGMDGQNPMFQQMNVVVADHLGFQQGQFFMGKMEQEMGAAVQACRSKQELMQTLQMAQQSGRSIDMVLAMDGLLNASEAVSLHQKYNVIVTQFGSNMQPQQQYGEGYIQTPGPGQMFNSNELYMIANKARTRSLAARTSAPGMAPGMGGGMNPMSQPMMAPGMGGMNVTPPPAGSNASVDVLLAEMNALKAYLNNGN